MSRIKKRRSKSLKNQRFKSNRKVLEATFLDVDINNFKKRIKKRSEIFERRKRIINNVNNRDRNIRILRKSNQLHTGQFKKALQRNIINNQKQIEADRRFIICSKRKSRRRILFSNKRIGSGKSGPRFRRYTIESKVRC